MTLQFEARLMGLRKTRNRDGGDWCECKLEIHPNDAQELFMLALGTRLGVAAVPITDDEKQAVPEKPKGGELARRAGILCEDERFQKWLLERSGEDWNDLIKFTEQWFSDDSRRRRRSFLSRVAFLLRDECGVQSRAELDHNPEAAEKFKALEAEYRQAHGMMAEKR